MSSATVVAPPERRRRGRVLDPIERQSEILFGLIMAMTFTGAIHAAGGGEEEIRLLLYGAIGCNVAWGIVDAVLYVLTAQIEGTRRFVLLRALKGAPTPAEADRLLCAELDDALAEHVRPEELGVLRAWVARIPDPPRRARVDARMLLGALGVFLLVALSTFPLVVPFLVLKDPVLALRVSHGIGLGLLFAVGAVLGRYSGQNPFWTGALMLGTGVVLVVSTILLGG